MSEFERTRREYFKQVVDEWNEHDSDDTDLNNAILNDAFKGSALEKMKNSRGKIKGDCSFPFSPTEF